MHFTRFLSVIAPVLLHAIVARADQAQSQFFQDLPMGASGTQMTFNRYNGPDHLDKAVFVAEAIVKVSFYADELSGSGIPWNLYATVNSFGFQSSSGQGAPIDYFNGPSQSQTVPSQGSVIATATFSLGQVTTTYTDPQFLQTFFVGNTPFTYDTGGAVSGHVDTEIFSIIPFRPVEITTTVGVNLFYFTSVVPEPATGLLLMLLGSGLRRPRGDGRHALND